MIELVGSLIYDLGVIYRVTIIIVMLLTEEKKSTDTHQY